MAQTYKTQRNMKSNQICKIRTEFFLIHIFYYEKPNFPILRYFPNAKCWFFEFSHCSFLISLCIVVLRLLRRIYFSTHHPPKKPTSCSNINSTNKENGESEIYFEIFTQMRKKRVAPIELINTELEQKHSLTLYKKSRNE